MWPFDRFVKPDVIRLAYTKNIKGLLRALRHRDADIRSSAAYALLDCGDSRAVEPLVQASTDQTSPVRKAALKALAKFRDPRAVAALTRALNDPDAHAREIAVTSLGALQLSTPDSKATDGLVKCVADSNRDVRLQAIKTLGHLREPRSVEAIVGAIGDKDWQVRFYAAEALNNIGDPRALTPLVMALRQEKDEELMEVLRKVLASVVADALRTEDSSHRAEAVAAITAVDHPSFLARVSAEMNYSPDSRQRMSEVLEEVGRDLTYANRLLAILNNKDADLEARTSAATVLAMLKNSLALQPLIKFLSYAPWDLACGCRAALARIGEPGLEALRLALKSSDRHVRSRAAWAMAELGATGDEQLVDGLIEAMLHDTQERVCDDAMMALAKIDDPRVAEVLVRGWDREPYIAPGRVALALTTRGDKRALPIIMPIINNATISQSGVHALSKKVYWAIHTLGELGDASVISNALPILEMLDRTVRERGIVERYVDTGVARGSVSTETDISVIRGAISKLKLRR